jgi:hypothetical protein
VLVKESARERVAAALSGTAVVFLSVAGAWYFGAAVWWLLKHDWPGWTWSGGLGWGRDAAPFVQFLADRSPGASALIVAGILAVLARMIDPARRRR